MKDYFVFSTHPELLLAVFLDVTGPPSSNRLLSKQGPGLVELLHWFVEVLQHGESTLGWSFCRGDEVVQVQFYCS